MKKLFATTALFVALATGASACVAQCAPTSSESFRSDPWIVDWSNSYVMFGSPYNEATGNWEAGVIVRTGNTNFPVFVGEQGLTDAIRHDPRLAQAWARDLTGDMKLRARGRTSIDVRATDCSTHTTETFAWN